jgi:hypothetical protein
LGPEKDSPTQKNVTKLPQSAPKYIVTWQGKLKYSLRIRIVHAGEPSDVYCCLRF